MLQMEGRALVSVIQLRAITLQGIIASSSYDAPLSEVSELPDAAAVAVPAAAPVAAVIAVVAALGVAIGDCGKADIDGPYHMSAGSDEHGNLLDRCAMHYTRLASLKPCLASSGLRYIGIVAVGSVHIPLKSQ
ncbi:hypothetical protein ACLOJK_013386 [Asimina triloba]